MSHKLKLKKKREKKPSVKKKKEEKNLVLVTYDKSRVDQRVRRK